MKATTKIVLSRQEVNEILAQHLVSLGKIKPEVWASVTWIWNNGDTILTVEQEDRPR